LQQDEDDDDGDDDDDDRNVSKFIAASRGSPCDSTAFLYYNSPTMAYICACNKMKMIMMVMMITTMMIGIKPVAP